MRMIFERFYLFVVLIALLVLYFKFHSLVSIYFRNMKLLWIPVAICSLLSTICDALLLQKVLNFEAPVSFRTVLKSNIAKIFGGGLSQLILVTDLNSNPLLTTLMRLKKIWIFNILASTPFALFLVCFPHSNVKVWWALFPWLAILLPGFYFFLSSEHDFNVSTRLIMLAFIAQLTAVLGVILCIPNHSIQYFGIIDFAFLVSLIVPIPNGIFVREFVLVSAIANQMSVTQIILSSATYRVVQTFSEFSLAFFSTSNPFK